MSFLVLLLTIGVYLIRPAEWIPGLDLRWNLILNVLGAVAVLWATITDRTRVVADRSWGFAVLFLLLMVVSNLVHAQVDTIGVYMPGMLTNILIYLLVPIALQTTKQADWFILFLIGIVLFICYQCYVQATAGENWAGIPALQRRSIELQPEGGRAIYTYTPQAVWVGVFKDPNDLGLLLVCFMPLAFAKTFFVKANLLAKAFWAATTGTLVYTIYLTNSRGTFVALLASVAAFFIIKYRSLVGLLVAATAGVVLITFGPSRLGSITSGDSAAMERVYAWILALELFAMYPFFGIGARHWADVHGRVTHNSYVLAFVENGFAAYVCYLAVFLIGMFVAVSVVFEESDSKRQMTLTGLAACLAGCMASIFFISRTYILVPYLITSVVITYSKLTNPVVFDQAIKKMNIIVLGAVAAASIVGVWIINRATTQLML